MVLEAAGTSAAPLDFKATADSLFRAVATRFADRLVDHFLGRERQRRPPHHRDRAGRAVPRGPVYEPYLRLASQFLEERGHGHIDDSGFGSYMQDPHLPVRENPAEVGHAVRALYLEAGIADVAAETGDRGLLAASATRWDDMVATKTALTGGNGSRHSGEAFGDAFELPPRPGLQRGPARPSPASSRTGGCCWPPARPGTPT